MFDKLLLQIVSKVEQLQEQQQIEHALSKKNLLKQTPVVTETKQKIFCHSCSTRTELSIKKFFYTFPDGKAVFFCNNEERKLWLEKNNKTS